MPDNDMIARSGAPDPAFGAELWQFMVDVNKGEASPSPHDHHLACTLAAMWQGITALLYQTRTGCTVEQAAEYVAQMILDQRSVYGSLAASE